MILYRRGMGSVEVVNPSGGGSHTAFARRALEAAAVGAGLTYDQVSGDLTQANYSNCRRHFQARAMARSTCGSWPSRPGSRAPSGGRIYGRPLRLRRVSGITTRMLVAVSLMQSDAWAAWVMPHKKARTIGPGFALAQKRFSVQRGSRPNCPEPGAEADRRRDSCPPPPPEARRGRCCCCCCRGFGAARCGRG
jgi:hypothetical protein